MSERLSKHLHDVLQAARLALEYLGVADLPAYLSDGFRRSAVERQVAIVGEASRRALDDAPALRERVPDLALAIAVRNRVVHAYDRVEHPIIFNAVRADFPVLIAALERELREIDDRGQQGGSDGP